MDDRAVSIHMGPLGVTLPVCSLIFQPVAATSASAPPATCEDGRLDDGPCGSPWSTAHIALGTTSNHNIF